jgi:hypothetical protein
VFDCCVESWIGDGYEDCADQAYGCDLTCYDNDGGDCGSGGGEVFGCTDVAACNYTSDANSDDGSCYFGHECPDGSYECELSNCSDGEVSGCTDHTDCASGYFCNSQNECTVPS